MGKKGCYALAKDAELFQLTFGICKFECAKNTSGKPLDNRGEN
jgi:hypothetical protein